ncbi:hypothetical protein [Providencia sp. PROV278]|uniref:hypothetical protein n=1 Tax=Providencia sp. PROV278 TaxID=2936803 RepID=UPI00298FADFA|nr:hypothetical protein [Providencia sp. PROV278]
MRSLKTLSMFNKSEKTLSGGSKFWNAYIVFNISRGCFRRASVKSIKILFYGFLIAFLLSFGEVNAQGVKIKSVDNMVIPRCQFSQIFPQCDFHWVRNKIEFLTFISGSSEVMTEPSTKEERKNSPKESNKAETGLKKQDEITQEDIEHFKSSLIGMLLTSLVMVPLGIIFSSHISPRILAKRKRWMKLHTLKAERFHRNNPNKYYTIPRKTFCQWFWF